MLLWTWLACATIVAQGGEPTTAASWIWYPEDVATEGIGHPRYLRRTIALEAAPKSARLRVRADDSLSFTVNGRPAPAPIENGPGGGVFDLTGVLRAGENVLGFVVVNAASMGGLIVVGRIDEAGGETQRIYSDTSFRTARESTEGWDRPGFADRDWPPAKIVGSAFAPPWYRHPAFDMEPFIEPGERERWEAWRAKLVALPAGLEREPDAAARLEYRDGHCVLSIDGRPRPALIYRGTVDPLTTHGRRQIALFRDAGVHVYTAYYPLASCWPEPDRLDFSRVDEIVRGYLSVDPDAYLILILRLVPPRWWFEDHADEMVRYAAGDDFNTTDESGRVRRPSFASKPWRHDMMNVWRSCIEHLEAQPWGRRVIGYQPGYGIYTEWHYFGSWREQTPDVGLAMTAHFRDWLRERYASDEDLREAWRQPDATPATATVPGVGPRLASGPLGLRDPAGSRWVSDYYRCQQELTVELIDAYCAAAKEVTDGRALAGVFYGYFQGVHPQTQGGHLELERLLSSPQVDYFAAPYDYAHRLMGDDGRVRALADVFPLAGKVHMIEADTRTYLHPRNEHGRLPDAASSIAAIRREVATALTHGSALWWCDFGRSVNGGWYDDPALIGEVGKLYKLAERRIARATKPVAEVAVIVDLRSCYLLDDRVAMQTHARLVDQVTTSLYRTGAPFDMILLSQLKEADLARYRALVFLNALEVDPPTREVVKAATRDRASLWLWSPGISDGARLAPELVRDLTGFRVAAPDGNLLTGTVEVVGDDPLLAGAPDHTGYELAVRDERPIAAAYAAENWYNPRDEKTMREAYTAYDLKVEAETIRWRVGTTRSWSDIHLRADLPECDGLRLEVAGDGALAGAGLRVVIKDADAAEFAGEILPVTMQPTERRLVIEGLPRAPWYRGDAERPRYPLTGLKLVLYGLGGGREGTLVVRRLATLTGEVVEQHTRSYGGPTAASPCLVVDDPAAVALGRDGLRGGPVVLAARGEKGRRHVISTLPFVPTWLLTAWYDEAGVHRYVDSPNVIVRADSTLLALHTDKGGPCRLRLPRAERLRDALTGEELGEGTAFSLILQPNSTMLLERRPVGG